MVKVNIDHFSIQKQIEDNIKTPFDAFNEYIWNSIDAKSKNIFVTIKTNGSDLTKLEISDDGIGINFEELEKKLFGTFNVSHKTQESNKSLPRGKRGFGRFSFIQFSEKVIWETIYKKKGNSYTYSISMMKNSLDDFEPTTIRKVEGKSETKVSFEFGSKNNCEKLGCSDKKDPLKVLKKHLELEFSWIIELFGINIYVNKEKLRIQDIMNKREEYKIYEINQSKFEIKFIKWEHQLKNQSSRFYFLNSKGEEVYVKTTTLNNKGDNFFHSLYIKGDYFDTFEILKTLSEKTFQELSDFIEDYLKKKRKPFVRIFSNKKYQEFEEKKLLPKFSKFEENTKKPIYEDIVKEIIEFAPSLASNANENQKRILLELIYRLLDDDSQRDTLYSILEVLVDEDNKTLLKDLEIKLKNYGLKNILGTIKLVEDRLKTVEQLREMFNYDKNYFFESDLQKIIEEHFWIFGEEYNLMGGAEEEDFNKLRTFFCEKVLKLKKEDYQNDKFSRKQVDLFICGNGGEGRKTKNLIVEIKRPNKNLTKEHYRQIEDYKDIINNIPDFNSPERHNWDFILLYNDISKDHLKFFQDKLGNGNIKGLAEDNHKNMRIFIIKWSDLLDECKFRLKFLKDKLEIKKKHIFEQNRPKYKEDFLKKFENSARIK